MIIEVGIAGAATHRYRVRRDRENIVVRRLAADGRDDGTSAAATDTVVDWRRPQAGVYSLLIEGKSYEVFIEDDGDHLAVHLRQQTFSVRAADIRRHRAVTDDALGSAGTIRIIAPIPGRVARILAAPGQEISRGQGIVVVEAMKMENELRAPRDGVVAAIEVAEGQGVEGGALLAVIE